MSASITDPRFTEFLQMIDELGPASTAKVARIVKLLPKCDKETSRGWRAMVDDGATLAEGLAFLEVRTRAH
jgi:hypothetical protein